MTYLLFDLTEREVDAIVKTSYTTKEEIESIICELKEEVEDYNYTDLLDRLPDDCSITWVHDNDYITW